MKPRIYPSVLSGFALLTSLALLASVAGCSGSQGGPCIPDADALLRLDYRAFDQDIPDGGWRGISNRAGCEVEAADLIATYREQHADSLQVSQRLLLYWHEGQVRAGAGQYTEAARLFKRATYPAPDDPYDDAWNLYAEATAAFVEGNRAALEMAYRQMLVLPEPDDWADYQAEASSFLGRTPAWPQNRQVVEQLIGCFGKPYDEAYGDASCADWVEDEPVPLQTLPSA